MIDLGKNRDGEVRFADIPGGRRCLFVNAMSVGKHLDNRDEGVSTAHDN